PHLVAADHDQIALWVDPALERVGRAEREGANRLAEAADLGPVAWPVGGRPRLGQGGAEGAAPLRDVDPPRDMVDHHRIMATRPQSLDQAAGLPVTAVVDAAVEGQNADAHAVEPPCRGGDIAVAVTGR